MDLSELHERLDKEHTDALLTNYSGDYEVWLEERIAQLEDELIRYASVGVHLGLRLEEEKAKVAQLESSLAEAINPTQSKIPLWILCGIKGKAKFDGGTLIHGSARFFLFGFYLDEEYCKMAKHCLENDHMFKDAKIWIDKSEANHMWVWDITDGP